MTGRFRCRSDGGMGYEEAKRLAAHRDAAVRARLASRRDVRPEILYYLAEDAAPEVRREIAANDATPVQAYRLLAEDGDDTVRLRLADKVTRLAPELGSEARRRVREEALRVLDLLARDQAARVRRVLAEALKDVAEAPPTVIQRLARDAEAAVALPVLELSPLLTDEDLLEIIEDGCLPDRLVAISRRHGLGERVSDAIVERDETAAITELLQNDSAQIREETLDGLVERARAIPPWHEPLVRRPRLSSRAVRALAGAVGQRLLRVLEARDDLDPETARAVAREVERRLERQGAEDRDDGSATVDGGAAAAAALDESAIEQALGRGERETVTEALGARSGLPRPVVSRVLAARSPRGVTALAWKAGLPMRLATQLQLRLGGIPPRQVLYPRDGTEYPLSAEDMTWQLEFFQSLND